MTVESKGMWLGLVGVAIFALTLPLTKLGLQHGFAALFLSFGRTVVAAAVGFPFLLLTRQPWPSWKDVGQLAFVMGGVIFGFPVLSALALQYVPASHGSVVLGTLPLATALMSTIFAGERPSPAFWAWSVLGAAAVAAFALWDGGAEIHGGDLLLVLAVFAAAMGYAAGAQLAKKLGGWQVISWALLLALPVTLPVTIWLVMNFKGDESLIGWGCFAYLALLSQLGGFYFWYRGLSLGGIARVGQVQLLQTFFTLVAAYFILAEPITPRAIVFALIVAACVWFGRKAAVALVQQQPVAVD
ncbi:DMT family transporter [Aestuariivirga litoralis]|uniref:DMT family transporter n=1 Tax=Aestuariivirga litoralis TaxID=2650924 RepID=UPI0018C49E57|nr:DMT family transporter [Aestuariivirga litoralis]MBG1231979.1 DMT family transporter [Aestuariivirga litoralis]